MTSTTIPVLTEASWALQNKLNPFPVAGELNWDGSTLTFTLGSLASDAVLGWVAKKLNDPDLASKLKSGEAITAFSWNVGEFKVSWPTMYAGSAIEVTGPTGASWFIAFDYPSGGALSQSISLFTGRKKGKVWKKALPA